MQPVQISIPTPCYEKWDTMQPVEQGRFCNACAKQVVDFSVMSDNEVLNYLNNLKGASVCGRATTGQLDRVMAPPAPVKKLHWFWQFAAIFLLLFSRSGEVKAQKMVGKIAMHPPVPKPDTVRMVGEMTIDLPKRAISGRILDSRGNAISSATILIAGTERRFISGRDGGFSFLINENEKQLVISAPGYTSQRIRLSGKTNYNIRLKSQMLQGDVRVTAGMVIIKPV